MDLYPLLRPLLFRLEPETAHRLALRVLRPVQWALARTRPRRAGADPLLQQQVFGLTFPNPIGLAAGFDKNAELPHVWAALGFGFAELGTITAYPQPGNPTPRIFRLGADRALINRLGFNNRGADSVSTDLALRLTHHRPSIPLGLNIGKSRAASLQEATMDYLASFRALFDLADYVAVNVSSPNTPGLRDLQSEQQLDSLLTALQDQNDRLAQERRLSPRPILVKVAPDLADEALQSIADVARHRRIAGLIATNTTIERPALRSPAALAAETGGLSGAPLRERSNQVIRALYRSTRGSPPIIGAGGVFSAQDAYEKIRAGACLVQVYTSFIYEGPALAPRLVRGMRQLLIRDGLPCIAAAVGRDAA